MAAVLAATGLHLPGRTGLTLFVAAGLLTLLAATTDGPLAAGRRLSLKAHSRLDLAVAAALALSPLAPGRTAVSALIVECVAFALWRVSLLTRFERSGKGLSVVEGTARALGQRAGAQQAARQTERTERPRSTRPSPSVTARALGILVGRRRRPG
ncbi:MAG TPA: hypothetical protein VFH45_03825 [Acidimicrobiales bacterium]|nr:hypothetical protein [Acidimicrobiales bacterium]